MIVPQMVLLLSHYFNSLVFLLRHWAQRGQHFMFQITRGVQIAKIKPFARVLVAHLVKMWCLDNFFEVFTYEIWLEILFVGLF
jgi:hypothetical protein